MLKICSCLPRSSCRLQRASEPHCNVRLALPSHRVDRIDRLSLARCRTVAYERDFVRSTFPSNPYREFCHRSPPHFLAQSILPLSDPTTRQLLGWISIDEVKTLAEGNEIDLDTPLSKLNDKTDKAPKSPVRHFTKARAYTGEWTAEQG